MKLFIERLKLVFLLYSSPIILMIVLILMLVMSPHDSKALCEKIKHTLHEQARKAGIPWEE